MTTVTLSQNNYPILYLNHNYYYCFRNPWSREKNIATPRFAPVMQCSHHLGTTN